MYSESENLLRWFTVTLASLSFTVLTGCVSLKDDSTFEAAFNPGETPVVLTQGTNMSLALSPDETTIAMSIQGILWTIPANGGEATPLTPRYFDAHEPVWSPDGEWIAFYAYADGGFQVWRVRPSGSDLEQLTTGDADVRYPFWLPEGNGIVYASDAKDGYQVWQLDLSTGDSRQLTQADNAKGQDSLNANRVTPTVSPDGSMLAYVVDGPKNVLVLQDLLTGEKREIFCSKEGLGAPGWSADGSTLYLMAHSYGDVRTRLLGISTSGGPPSVLVSEGDIFPFRPSARKDGSIVFSADGLIKSLDTRSSSVNTIPFSATVGLIKRNYKKRTYNLSDRTPQPVQGLFEPILSPDGQTAAFVALGDLWAADVTTGAVKQLTDDTAVDIFPSWSPDGERIAFVSDRGGKPDIWALELKRGVFSRLSDLSQPPSALAWSPVGDKIVFLQNAGVSVFLGSTVEILDIETGAVEQVHGALHGPSAPTWAPDGTAIAVIKKETPSTRYREGYNVIYIMSLSSGATPIIVRPEGAAHSLGRRQWNGPSWGANGQFAYVADGRLRVIQLSSEGEMDGAPKTLAEGTLSNPSWSGDGSRLIYLDETSLKTVDAASGQQHTVPISLSWTRAIPDGQYTLRVGRVLDSSGEHYLTQQDIFISGDRITDILPSGTYSPKGPLIDMSGLTVLPGFIESHGHLATNFGQKVGRAWLKNGVTTVRDPGSDPYEAVGRREAIASGRREGPRLFSAGALNGGRRVHYGSSEPTGDEANLKYSLRQTKALQLDWYKSYVRQGFRSQREAIKAMHAAGIPVTSHELYPSVAYGIDAIEHVKGTSRRGFSLKHSKLGHSYNDVIDLIVASGVIFSPTIVIVEPFSTEAMIANAQETIRRVVRAGGVVTAGTDALVLDKDVSLIAGGAPLPSYGNSLHRELELFVAAGLTPAEAIRSVTSNAAVLLGVEDQLGAIKPGMIADLILVDGDPLANIQDTRQVVKVVKGGLVFNVGYSL